MTHDGSNATPPIDRIPTGVPGLDEVMGGGLLKSGVYIFQGVPGAGKTILANHIAHRHAAQGGQVVYVTLLAESHARLLQHMQSFSFFQPSLVPQKVYYVSAFNALRSEGLKGVVDLLRSEMRARHAGILVLDGLVMAASAAGSDEELKVFVSDVQTHSALVGCTTLLLTSEQADRPVSAEQTMVDGIVLLREHAFGARRERNIEVVKFRGSRTLRGNHAFEINPGGIEVFPRLEASRRQGPGDTAQATPVSSGVPGLDRMFEIGGYAKGSVTAVSGPSGSGKTTLGLHFLARGAAEDSALHLGFFERPELLRRICETVRVPHREKLLGPNVEFMWQPFCENVLDEMAYRLLDRVERTRPARVVIDSAGGLMAAPAFQERGAGFLTALTNELRRLGATTLITVEQQDASRALVLDTASMSSLADTVVDLHLVQDVLLRRRIAIRKSRLSRHDSHVRAVALGDEGFTVVPEEPAGGA